MHTRLSKIYDLQNDDCERIHARSGCHFGSHTAWEFFTAKSFIQQCHSITDEALVGDDRSCSNAAAPPKRTVSLPMFWHNKCARRDRTLDTLDKTASASYWAKCGAEWDALTDADREFEKSLWEDSKDQVVFLFKNK